MVVNWDRGKFAALVEIRGALSRPAKRELYLEHGTCISLPGTACVVHLELSYVHLGSDVCVGGSMGPAVAARVRAQAQAMSPLRRCVCALVVRCLPRRSSRLLTLWLGCAILLARGTGSQRASLSACKPRWSVATGVRCPCRTVILLITLRER